MGGGDKRPIEMESSEKKMIEGEPRRMERKREKKYSRKREREKIPHRRSVLIIFKAKIERK